MYSLGFLCTEDGESMAGWLKTQLKALRGMKPDWVLAAEANAHRQLFPALALPSNTWHPALAAHMAGGRGGCPETGPCQSLPAAAFAPPLGTRTKPGISGGRVPVQRRGGTARRWAAQVRCCGWGSGLCAGAHQSQTKQLPQHKGGTASPPLPRKDPEPGEKLAAVQHPDMFITRSVVAVCLYSSSG